MLRLKSKKKRARLLNMNRGNEAKMIFNLIEVGESVRVQLRKDRSSIKNTHGGDFTVTHAAKDNVIKALDEGGNPCTLVGGTQSNAVGSMFTLSIVRGKKQ